MHPTLLQGQIVVGIKPVRWFWRGADAGFRLGSVVIVKHDGREKIKRIAKASRQRHELYLLGDNPAESSDSRQFGWVPAESVLTVVVFPRIAKQLQRPMKLK